MNWQADKTAGQQIIELQNAKFMEKWRNSRLMKKQADEMASR